MTERNRFTEQVKKIGGAKPSGIATLLSDEPSPEVIANAKLAGRFISLPPDRFRPDPMQPRKTIEQEALDELRESIETRGQLQPIVVRPAGLDGVHEILVGERRWRAISASQLVTTIDAIIRDVDSELEALLDQLHENDKREGVIAVETAAAYQRVVSAVKEQGGNLDAAAQKIGKSKSRLSKYLAVLKAPEFVQELSTSNKTQDIELLYQLSNLAKDHADSAKKIIGDWHAGRIDGDIREAVERVIAAKTKPAKTPDKSVARDPKPVKAETAEVSKANGGVVVKLTVAGKVHSFAVAADLWGQLISDSVELVGEGSSND